MDFLLAFPDQKFGEVMDSFANAFEPLSHHRMLSK